MRGRPLLGGLAGFFLGIFVAYDLLLLKVVVSDSPVFVVLPLALLVVGVLLGRWGPLGRSR
ncbi:hypothetical protein BH20ACT1_BH20ACT1_11570 [soil metagenome]